MKYLNMAWNYQSGNLTSRNDAIKGKTETFAYDNLNRLTSATVSGQSAMTTSYAANGNILSKTDAGAYSYGIPKIHAATEVTNPSGIVPSQMQGITYTAFFQPNVVTEGPNELTFTYGADYERVKTVQKLSGTTTSTKYFFGAYEKEVSGGQTTHLHYLAAGGLNIIVTKVNSGADTYHYAYTDHLGSLLTVTTGTGAIAAEQNFDAWGRKRNPSTWTYTSIPAVPYWLYRGYTGHEDLPTFGLVNMNGRLYDPVLGRMLSTDNYVQDPGYSQNYNRYSYAFNNPLKYNDPNGEWVHIVIGAAVGGLFNGFVHLDQGFEGFAKGFAIGAVAGAVTALTGGAAVGLYSGAGITAGALTGAGSSSFIGGAIAGGAGAVVGSPLQGGLNALVFGDKYTGGKFLSEVASATLLGGFFWVPCSSTRNESSDRKSNTSD